MSSTTSILPLILVLLPTLGTGAVVIAARFGDQLRSHVTNAVAFATFAVACWQFYLVQQGMELVYALEGFMQFGLRWKVDYVSAVFAVVVTLVWFLATAFAREYMAHEHHQTRFFAFWTFTLGGTVGVFVAGDLFSLFLFFEAMTFAAYVLVIHEQDPESMRAGNVYLYLSVAGGLALLGVIFLLQFVVGATGFEPALHLIVEQGISPWLIIVMLIGGFGVKAGMIPLHIWLPKAHPVAPAPASAVLSAIMIKTGAYGFLRLLFVVLSVPDGHALFSFQQNFGYIFVWIGAITMFIGAIMGILNDSMKRVLAYSSISQMGYILFALGSGVLLGSRGAFGFAGAWMHMINHAFFKSFLFLLAGAVFLHTGELDLDKLGGLRKQMPVALGFFLVAAASITGIPGLNGYASKIVIHEAILEAYHFLGWPSLLFLERVFVVTGGLTAAYISKIWIKTFFGKAKRDWSEVTDLSRSHRLIFGAYLVIVLAIGVFPQRAVDKLVIPAARLLPFYQGDLDHLGHVPFWGSHEVMSPLTSYAIAAVVLLLLWKFGKYIRVPRWLSVEFLVYRQVYNGSRAGIRGLIYLADTWLPRRVQSLTGAWRQVDRVTQETKAQIKRWKPPKVELISTTDLMKKLEEARDGERKRVQTWRSKEGELAKRVQRIRQDWQEREEHMEDRIYDVIEGVSRRGDGERKQTSLLEEIQEALKRPVRRKFNPYWNTKNLGFDTWIVAIVIALILFVFLVLR
ncbi:MAG: NADH dehydrogenase [Firmicutes bacterium]|nr:NADH dehydrogenase [Bacillota bacterium]